MMVDISAAILKIAEMTLLSIIKKMETQFISFLRVFRVI